MSNLISPYKFKLFSRCLTLSSLSTRSLLSSTKQQQNYSYLNAEQHNKRLHRLFSASTKSPFDDKIAPNVTKPAPRLTQAINAIKEAKPKIIFSASNKDKIIDWFIEKYGEPMEPNKLANSEMPLLGRDSELEQVYESLKKRYQAKSPNKDNQPVIVISGAPGTGKTRLLEEIGIYLKDKPGSDLPKSHLNLSISFGDNSPFNPQRESNPDLAIGSRILFRYFAESSGERLEEFMDRVKSFMDLADISPVLCFSIILSHKARNNHCQEGQKIMINFGIDEFQKTLDETTKYPIQRSAYLKSIINSISSLLIGHRSSTTFYNIVLAGTLLEDIRTIITQSTIGLISIQPRMLNKDECMYIAERMIGKERSDLPQVRRALQFMGGWPRVMEIFFQSIPPNLESTNTSQLLTLCDPKLNEKYSQKGDKTMSYIIAYSIAGLKINPNSKPHPDSPTFSELEASSFFTFTPDNKVFIPLNFIRRHLNLCQNVPPIFGPISNIIKLFQSEKFDLDDWKDFLSNWEQAKINAFKFIQPQESISILKYYNGSIIIHPEKIKNTFINTSQVIHSKLIKPKKRCPDSIPLETSWIENCDVIKNPPGASVDLIRCLKTSNGTMVIFGDGKHTPNGGKLCLSDIKRVLTNTRKDIKQISFNFDPLVVIYSNRKLEDSFELERCCDYPMVIIEKNSNSFFFPINEIINSLTPPNLDL